MAGNFGTGVFTTESAAARLLATMRLGVIPAIPVDGVFIEWMPGKPAEVREHAEPYRHYILRYGLPLLVGVVRHGTGCNIMIYPKEAS